jgi:hypothetical protein
MTPKSLVAVLLIFLRCAQNTETYESVVLHMSTLGNAFLFQLLYYKQGVFPMVYLGAHFSHFMGVGGGPQAFG